MKKSKKIDEFFIARLRLTFYYSITAIIILGGSSILLYKTIISNFAQSALESVGDLRLAIAITERTQDILLSGFLTIDSILIFLIIILGFLLTFKTLEPIKTNLEKQKRFIADASHELRTPTAVIISGLEVNLANKNLDLAQAKKTLESTLEEMREFSKLSNTLLDLSTYDKKKESETIEMSELVESIVEKNKNLAEVKNITLETKLHSQAKIQGNKIELGRVIYNILDNAIKYTPQGGMIIIKDEISGNKYILIISDSGIGIAKNILSRIFDPFFRADGARSTSGAGLGLTLSKNIVEDHGGTISIKSQENKGTNVTIALPLSSS